MEKDEKDEKDEKVEKVEKVEGCGHLPELRVRGEARVRV